MGEESAEVNPIVAEIRAAEAEVRGFGAEVVKTANAFADSEKISHRLIDELLQLTAQASVAPAREVVDYMLREANQAAEALRQTPGVVAVLGTGHPFYAIDVSGEPIEVAEIGDFLAMTRAKVQADAQRNHDKWPCTSCEIHRPKPDLKQLCKPCDLVQFRPRDLFKALPDLDLFVVVGEHSGETEARVEARMRSLGYQQSDISIAEGIRRSREVVGALVAGHVPREKLPIDIHLVSKEDFLAGMRRIVDGGKDVLIHERALRMGWGDELMNLAFDLTFSMTEIGMYDLQFKQEFRHARRAIANAYSNPSEVLLDMARHSPRAERLVRLEPVARALIGRVASWREDDYVG